MYRSFRRFEWLAFGMVTASAIACASLSMKPPGIDPHRTGRF